MIYKKFYETPKEFSNIWMISDGECLTGLWFEDSKRLDEKLSIAQEKSLEIFEQTEKWLDIYFSGENPNFVPKYKILNATQFRETVLNILTNIPYGTTVTYNDVAKIIAQKRNIKKMSAQAVGGAVGWNPICIIIPCHRVIGSNGEMIGYGGGLQNKIELLKFENLNYANIET